MRVSLWLGVCIYTYGYIYIDADDDDILGHFLFWSAVFLSIRKGNNTFDGKIIVTWLKKKKKKIARLRGRSALQGHNIYDARSRRRIGVYMSEMILFCFWFSADFFGPSCVSGLASFQARGNRWFFVSDVPSSFCLFVFFYFYFS